VRLLAQDALGGELLAESARAPGFRLELDSDPEAASADLLDVRRADRAQALESVGAELRRVLDHPFLDQHLECLPRDRCP